VKNWTETWWNSLSRHRCHGIVKSRQQTRDTSVSGQYCLAGIPNFFCKYVTQLWFNKDHLHVTSLPSPWLIIFQVYKVHILCENSKDPDVIKAQNLREDWKLHFHFLGRRMRYKDAFQYASNNLLRRNVMIMNADCYVDKGFERLDESILNRKTMYALTRHETPENKLLCKTRDFCGPKSHYMGSHDAFLFRLLVPLPSQLLDSIDYRPNIRGIEQVLIFYFKKYVQFDIRNPCKILYIVHHHCNLERNMAERSIQGKRIDTYLHIKREKRRLYLSPFSGL